jgi:ubiquinone/menaquinone biosynthesis C-methylase UbiE
MGGVSPDERDRNIPPEGYIHDYEGLSTKQLMRARTAANSAAFLLPYLRRGQELLDIGCGQGTITVGLARAVSPGEVVGLDVAESQVSAAREHAKEQGVPNVRFVMGDAYHLDFATDTFDVVFSNALLTHLSRPVEVLKEAWRVLKPEGIIGVREMDAGTSLHYPPDPVIEAHLEIYLRFRRHSGGDPTIGRRLKALLREAGFQNSWASGSCSAPSGTSEDVKARVEMTISELIGPKIREIALKLGWADTEHFDRVEQALMTFHQHPDAFSIRFCCEAIGWKS